MFTKEYILKKCYQNEEIEFGLKVEVDIEAEITKDEENDTDIYLSFYIPDYNKEDLDFYIFVSQNIFSEIVPSWLKFYNQDDWKYEANGTILIDLYDLDIDIDVLRETEAEAEKIYQEIYEEHYAEAKKILVQKLVYQSEIEQMLDQQKFEEMPLLDIEDRIDVLISEYELIQFEKCPVCGYLMNTEDSNFTYSENDPTTHIFPKLREYHYLANPECKPE